MTKRVGRFVILASLALAGGSTIARAQDSQNLTSVPMEMIQSGNEKLPRLIGKYLPQKWRWNANDRVSDVLAVYPHPVVTNRIYLATESGLLLSTDGGDSFKPLAAANSDKISPVLSIAFQPDNPDRLLLGTREKGLFVSNDAGKTVKPIGNKASGMASDLIRAVYIAADDRLGRTLIAVHGTDAPGLSRSIDGGQTWQILFPEQHILRVDWTTRTGKQVLLEAAPVSEPDTRTLYFLNSLQEPWQKLMDNITIVGSALPQHDRSQTIYIASADKGLYRISRGGGVMVKTGPEEEIEWSSFGMTYASSADSEMAYGYDPKQRGMLMMPEDTLDSSRTEDNKSSPVARTMSDGLFVGPIVLEGAHIRANAGGTKFFAAVNRQLYYTTPVVTDLSITRVTLDRNVLLIDRSKMKEAQAAIIEDVKAFGQSHRVAEAAKTLGTQLDEKNKILDVQRFTVTARVQARETSTPPQVSVDLSRLKLSAHSALYDDGNHNDGAAGDGLYANSFKTDFQDLRTNQTDWRQPIPGPLPLTVSAFAGQLLAGAVVPIGVYEKQDSIPFLNDPAGTRASGKVVANRVKLKKEGIYAFSISVKEKGPWSVTIGQRATLDISGMEGIALNARSSSDISPNLSLQLRDAPTYSRPTPSPKISLNQDSILPAKITPKDQKIVVPLAKILSNPGEYQPSITSTLILSGEASGPFDLTIHGIRFLPQINPVGDEEETP